MSPTGIAIRQVFYTLVQKLHFVTPRLKTTDVTKSTTVKLVFNCLTNPCIEFSIIEYLVHIMFSMKFCSVFSLPQASSVNNGQVELFCIQIWL